MGNLYKHNGSIVRWDWDREKYIFVIANQEDAEAEGSKAGDPIPYSWKLEAIPGWTTTAPTEPCWCWFYRPDWNKGVPSLVKFKEKRIQGDKTEMYWIAYWSSDKHDPRTWKGLYLVTDLKNPGDPSR